MRQVGLAPVTLAAKEGLALNNGTSVSAALACLALLVWLGRRYALGRGELLGWGLGLPALIGDGGTPTVHLLPRARPAREARLRQAQIAVNLDLRPEATDRQLLQVGRGAAVAGGALGLVLALAAYLLVLYSTVVRSPTPADAALMMQLGVDGVFVGSGIFKSGEPALRAKAIVQATTHYRNAAVLAELSANLGQPMVGINVSVLEEKDRLAGRGW